MGTFCKICGKDMMKTKECTIPKLHTNGKVYDRIKVGAPGDFDEGRPEAPRCHDCNALFGHLHHWGCDAEQCPACGSQLISCECEGVFIEGWPIDISKGDFVQRCARSPFCHMTRI